MRESRYSSTLAGLFSTVVVLLLWEAAGRLLQVRPIMLPLPSAILMELGAEFPWYMGHAAYTLLTTMGGFLLSVIGGVAIAAVIVGSRTFERFVWPVIVAFNSVPKVAIAPLFVIWMGTGAEPKVAIAFLIAVFAIIVDTVHGLRSVPPDVTDLSRVLKGSAWDVFWKVKLPCALPSIVTGMKVAISLALVGAIVGEFVSSQRGLGYVIMSAQGTFDTVRVFAALFILAIMGMVLYGALVLLERRATPWRNDPSH
ncbi:ABC transporter permease [Pigmentiphaga litoralis]|uniref:NitT/TauT family transport system permease protein n=1 Tax=Pigmentiphaga litoralis TaxID=516702 RepID=A0A7Y9IXE5_9BURK|nr:ABC transporter permease [Pigmentiphaga litoralis]NYE25746.1 NitT/TauT family transport system permease protein [Pigmentiphaga litoralis]NYE84866.1 NitT/TauT family transport system permease protein [Pigmentiphaga litoralis]